MTTFRECVDNYLDPSDVLNDAVIERLLGEYGETSINVMLLAELQQELPRVLGDLAGDKRQRLAVLRELNSFLEDMAATAGGRVAINRLETPELLELLLHTHTANKIAEVLRALTSQPDFRRANTATGGALFFATTEGRLDHVTTWEYIQEIMRGSRAQRTFKGASPSTWDALFQETEMVVFDPFDNGRIYLAGAADRFGNVISEFPHLLEVTFAWLDTSSEAHSWLPTPSNPRERAKAIAELKAKRQEDWVRMAVEDFRTARRVPGSIAEHLTVPMARAVADQLLARRRQATMAPPAVPQYRRAPRTLPLEVIDALAEEFSIEEGQRLVAEAGFSRGRQPSGYGYSGQLWWSEVARNLEGGVAINGVENLIAIARRERPENPYFQ